MRDRVLQIVTALASGVIFGFGLSLSGMLDPARVRGFLDVAGNWDPSLVFVLAGAITVAAVGVVSSRQMRKPFFDRVFHLPTGKRIDRRLILGSALFGVGWGLVGLCPGPAIASLATGRLSVAVFVVAMLAGMMVHDRLGVDAAVKPIAERGK